MIERCRSFLRIAIVLLSCVPAMAQRWAPAGNSLAQASARTAILSQRDGGYGGTYYFSSSSPLDVPPNYWWVSPYPSEDPCQAGCNLNAGYAWDTVGALIVESDPPQARVTLNGIYAGTADNLGPFQLPIGEHRLRFEAAGFELCDVVVRFDEPGVQSLKIALKRLTAAAPPAPKPDITH